MFGVRISVVTVVVPRWGGIAGVILCLLAVAPAVHAQPFSRHVLVFRENTPGTDPVPGEQPTRYVVGFSLAQISGHEFFCDTVSAPPEDESTPNQEPYRLNSLKRLFECATANPQLFGPNAHAGTPIRFGTPKIRQRAWAARHAASVIGRETKASVLRAFLSEGEGLAILSIQPATLVSVTGASDTRDVYISGARAKIKVTETERKSRLQADLETFARLAAGIALRRAAAPFPPPIGETRQSDVMWVTSHVETLRYDRATVSAERSFDQGAHVLASDYELDMIEEWRPEQARFQSISSELEALAQLKARLTTTACEQILQPIPGPTPEDTLKRSRELDVLGCRFLHSTTNDLKLAALEALAERPEPASRGLVREATLNNDVGLKAAALRSLTTGSGPSPPAPPGSTSGNTEASVSKTSLFTGSKEHWFLSADVLIGKGVEFGETDGQITVAGTPPSFYVGVDYLVGDLASDRRSFLNNIFLKAFVKGSTHPEDSFGIGIGLRGFGTHVDDFLKKAGLGLLDLNILSPFVSVTFTKPEDDGAERQRHLRFGVSLNLDKALGWIQ